MFLKRFIFINWGNLPPITFEFGPVNLLSGGNGSGKTTAADAIQTVMTAAHENLFQFNPGQDETTQRGRGGKRVRTLSSYVLGCDDGSYARLDPTDGYLAAVFHPTESEPGEPFTAIIGVRAWLDTAGSTTVARQDDAQFFVLPGEQLTEDHFIRQNSDEQNLVALDQLQILLIAEFGNRAVEKYDAKKAYLRRLYGALQGRTDPVAENEAVAAARAFSRFMAYKPVQSIDRFVSDEILERKDLGEAVRSVSGQLKTIHAMEREAARLVESIELLDKVKIQSQLYIENWIELNVFDYVLAQHEFKIRQREYVKAKKDKASLRHESKQSELEVQQLKKQSKQLHDQIVSLEAQRQGIDALRKKDELENQLAAQNDQLIKQSRMLLEDDMVLRQNVVHSKNIAQALGDPELSTSMPQLADMATLTQAAAMASHGEDGHIDASALTQRDLSDDLNDLEQHLQRARELQQRHNLWYSHWFDESEGEKARDSLSGHVHASRTRYENLSQQRKQKQQEIERLNAKQITYPHYVEKALDAIHQQCPQADPRVLCDHVEVKDSRWQSAIEGYLGGARYSILVASDYEAEAIRTVRGLPGRDNRARVVQGEKAAHDADRIKLDNDSIIHVLEFTHATAHSYLVASYGAVQRVDSAEQLKFTRRGLTTDGMASGNYSMFRCDLADADLVFGVAARERALIAKQEELAQIETEWAAANDRMQQASSLLKSVDELKSINYADALGGILETHREIQKLERLLDQLDLSEHQDLENKLIQLHEAVEKLRDQEGVTHQGIGELEGRLQALEKTLVRLNELQEKNLTEVERCETDLHAIATVWTDFDPDVRLTLADEDADELNPEHAQNHRAETESRLNTNERKLSEYLQAHNQHCRPGDAVAYTGFLGDWNSELFQAICDVQRQSDLVYNGLRNNILVEKHQRLAELKLSFNSAFVTNLCHSIHQAISDGKRQIELLNKELQHHHFGSDQETFRFASSWIPEYRDYARFFEEVIKSPSLGDEVSLFEADLSQRSRKVRESLMAMLLDEDSQRALRELERIADYRHYRKYEIYKDVPGKEPIPLSEYGTGSGGQLETPAYIIRSAAITSAFRFSEGSTHLRMVLVDEAFSKMDETRSREVIGYLTETLGLQLIFIMPTSKCGPYIDLISNEFVFAKSPSEVPRGELNTRVLVDRKRCNQEKIKILWANHRKTVYQQASLDFMEEILADDNE